MRVPKGVEMQHINKPLQAGVGDGISSAVCAASAAIEAPAVAAAAAAAVVGMAVQ